MCYNFEYVKMLALNLKVPEIQVNINKEMFL